MISQSPQIRIRTNTPIGNDLFFTLPELQASPSTFLDADSSAGATSLSANGTSFAINQYIILGQPGSIKSEIVKISSVSSTSIGVNATVFPHNRGDVITLIEYNQIVPERSIDGGTNFSALTTVNIDPQSPETLVQRTGDTATDVYRFRFFNSTTSLYSGYSDSVIASGYEDNTVFAIKKRALTQIGERIDDLITNDVLNDALNEARRIVDTGIATVDGKPQRVLRWSFRTKFNTDIGNVVPGAWSVSAPTDLRDRNTNKNILGVRIGRSNWPCVYQDVVRFNQNYLNVAHTTLNGAITSGSTSIVLTSSGDFDDSGTIIIGAENVSNNADIVTYTSNTLSTNTLGGASGIDSGGHASGRDVWQQVTLGVPRAYTINNGYIYFDVPFSNDIAGQNIYLDYYQTLTPVNSDSDVLDEPFYDLYVSYLKYKIKALKSNGSLNAAEDSDYLMFQQGFGQLVAQELSGQVVSFVPDVIGTRYRNNRYYP